MTPRRYFAPILICLFIILMSNRAEPIPNEKNSRRVESIQNNSSSLSEQETPSEDRSTSTLLRRSPTFRSLNKRAPQSPQRAANDLINETANVNQDLKAIKNKKSSARQRKNLANDALRQEAKEDKNRAILAKSAGGRKSRVVREADALVKKNGPSVINGFKQIAANPGDKKNVKNSLQQIDKGRVGVKKANTLLEKAGTKNGRRGGR